jgi:hypothetical protein
LEMLAILIRKVNIKHHNDKAPLSGFQEIRLPFTSIRSAVRLSH